jgi:SAM-dependent methyltransferase
MDPRRRSYWDLYDFSVGKGLEIGPLHRAMATREEAQVHYVDVLDREGLVRHYADDPAVPAERIPEIDYPLIQSDGRTLDLVEATAAGAPFDWVIASHVIEHVPDVIGWLRELAEIVVDDGVLVLAVPDRRYCFDAHRPPTTLGQMVAAHRRGDRRPAVGSVFDYFADSVDYDIKALWRGELPSLDRRIHDSALTWAKVEAAEAGEYVDCHVWLFSPDSFLQQLHDLRASGLSSWYVERLEPTPRNDLEFRVLLRRLPRGSDAIAPLDAEVTSPLRLPAWLHESRVQVDELDAKVRRLQARLDRRNTELARLRRSPAVGRPGPAARRGRLDRVLGAVRSRLRRVR